MVRISVNKVFKKRRFFFQTILWLNKDMTCLANIWPLFSGSLHVLWQISFGCWLTTSQADNSFFFFYFLNDKIYNYTPPKNLFGFWQFDFIIQKFAGLKSKHISQFFWWEVNLRGLRAFVLQKVQTSVVERQKKKFCYPSLRFEKKKHSYYTFVRLR